MYKKAIIVFEGIEASGKSLHINSVSNYLKKNGRKFIKIIRDNSVWGFVAKKDGVHKGLPMKSGDVLKAAGWSAPAKHTRGNIFNKNQDLELFLWHLQARTRLT